MIRVWMSFLLACETHQAPREDVSLLPDRCSESSSALAQGGKDVSGRSPLGPEESVSASSGRVDRVAVRGRVCTFRLTTPNGNESYFKDVACLIEHDRTLADMAKARWGTICVNAKDLFAVEYHEESAPQQPAR